MLSPCMDLKCSVMHTLSKWETDSAHPHSFYLRIHYDDMGEALPCKVCSKGIPCMQARREGLSLQLGLQHATLSAMALVLQEFTDGFCLVCFIWVPKPEAQNLSCQYKI